MNFDSPAMLFSGLIIGTLGFGMFLYGKKSESPGPLAIGLGICILPMLIHSLAVLWAVTGASCVGAWLSNRLG